MASQLTAPQETPDLSSRVDSFIEQDPEKPGRHHARFIENGTRVSAVLGTWRRTNGNVLETRHEWNLPDDALEAAIHYYEQHRDLFDAVFLLEREEWAAWNRR